MYARVGRGPQDTQARQDPGQTRQLLFYANNIAVRREDPTKAAVMDADADADRKGVYDPVVDVHPLDAGKVGQTDDTSQQPQHTTTTPQASGMLTTLWRWSPAIFMASYFVFSISIYTLSPRAAVKVLWFLYLTIGTILAGTTLLEAYDGLSLLRAARKTVEKFTSTGRKADDAESPHVELILDDVQGDGYERVRALRASIVYPQDKMRITVLPDHGDDAALVNHLCNIQDRQSGPLPEFTAIFRAWDSPHPHAIRHAVERLSSDKKIDIVQSRSVLTWPSGVPVFRAIYSSLAAFQHDATYGLTLPGRTITWGLPTSHGSAIYSRTSALQNAVRTLKDPASRHNAPAIAFSAYAQNSKAAYDMSVVTYTQCPVTFLGCSRLQIQMAAEWVASVSYASLALTKPRSTASEKSGTATTRRTLKQRISILFTLLLARLGSHAILQYFSLALALLFSETPQSTADFSRLIFFPYQISIWLVASGLICLVGTVAMIHKAASEYAPPGWAFPVLLVAYPLMILGQAVVDVYAQAGVFLGAL
jgi:hypothetical protein